MTINQIHAAVVSAYREAIADTEFKDVPIIPIDRETDDVIRGAAETEYDASYSREIEMKVTTVNEDLYYYASDPKSWKIELNDFQEIMESRLLKGIGDLEVTDILCETGRTGETGGVLHLSFTVTDYEVIDFDGRETAAEVMENIDEQITVKTL
jgi:hypothetical protein